tara:strand:+ start:750 stop:992 length:243 start_codon:yes stop_codon:yes gene_type:complete
VNGWEVGGRIILILVVIVEGRGNDLGIDWEGCCRLEASGASGSCSQVVSDSSKVKLCAEIRVTEGPEAQKIQQINAIALK